MNDPLGVRFVALQAALLVAIGLGPALSAMDPASPTAASWLGTSLMLLGGGLVAIAAARLGRSLTPFPRPRPGGGLVTRGIYARARHPIYGGVLLLAVGWSLVAYSIVSAVATALLWWLLEGKARYEEQALREAYPGYAAYAERTRRFVPFVY